MTCPTAVARHGAQAGTVVSGRSTRLEHLEQSRPTVLLTSAGDGADTVGGAAVQRRAEELVLLWTV